MKSMIKLVLIGVCITSTPLLPSADTTKQYSTAARFGYGNFLTKINPATLKNIKIAAATVGALAAVKLIHYWFTPDRSFPTINKLNITTFLPIVSADNQPIARTKPAILACMKKKSGIIEIKGKLYQLEAGIPEKINTFPVCTIYSPGMLTSVISPAFFAYTSIKAENIPHGACIAFDYPTRARRSFNFCQEQDLHCLKTVYKELISKHPKAQVVLFGACIGATSILRMITTTEEPLTNVKAVIVESPVISPKKNTLSFDYGRTHITYPV